MLAMLEKNGLGICEENDILDIIDETGKTPGPAGLLIAYLAGRRTDVPKGGLRAVMCALMMPFILIVSALAACAAVGGEEMTVFRIIQGTVFLIYAANTVRLRKVFPGKYTASAVFLTVLALSAFLGAGQLPSALIAAIAAYAADRIYISGKRS